MDNVYAQLQNFNVGDRVEAVDRQTGDSAQFVVTTKTGLSLWSAHNIFQAENNDFTLLQPAPDPLPTDPGIYSLGRGLRYLKLTDAGQWFWLDFHSGFEEPVTDAFRWHEYTLTQVYSYKSEFESND